MSVFTTIFQVQWPQLHSTTTGHGNQKITGATAGNTCTHNLFSTQSWCYGRSIDEQIRIHSCDFVVVVIILMLYGQRQWVQCGITNLVKATFAIIGVCTLTHTPVGCRLRKKGQWLWKCWTQKVMLRHGTKHTLILSAFFHIIINIIIITNIMMCVCFMIRAVILSLVPPWHL